MYEVTNDITYAGHNNFTTAVMANKDFFDGLSDEDKSAVHAAIQAAFDHIVEYQHGLKEESLAKIREAKPDMRIVELTAEQQQPFRDAAGTVEAAFIEMTGDSGKAILEQMKADIAAAEGQ